MEWIDLVGFVLYVGPLKRFTIHDLRLLSNLLCVLVFVTGHICSTLRSKCSLLRFWISDLISYSYCCLPLPKEESIPCALPIPVLLQETDLCCTGRLRCHLPCTSTLSCHPPKNAPLSCQNLHDAIQGRSDGLEPPPPPPLVLPTPGAIQERKEGETFSSHRHCPAKSYMLPTS